MSHRVVASEICRRKERGLHFALLPPARGANTPNGAGAAS